MWVHVREDVPEYPCRGPRILEHRRTSVSSSIALHPLEKRSLSMHLKLDMLGWPTNQSQGPSIYATCNTEVLDNGTAMSSFNVCTEDWKPGPHD